MRLMSVEWLICSLHRFDPGGCTRSISVTVAILNLPYHRFVIGKAPVTPGSSILPTIRRLQTCDTADFNSALRVSATPSTDTAFGGVLTIGRALRVICARARVKERLFGVIIRFLT